MREFKLLINGADVEGSGWTYVLRGSDFLRDPIGTFNLKRALELGTHPGEIPDSVEARCAWGDSSHTQQAIEAAHRAAPLFSQVPFDVRTQIVRESRQAVLAQVDELIELLIIEGHPRRLAEWEISGLICSADDGTLEWYGRQFHTEFAEGDQRLELVRKPDGVVCLNPPQNAAGSNGCLGIFAVLAGNSLVVKAPRSTPLSTMFLYREILQPILTKHGAPDGTLNIISGDSREIIRDWLASDKVNDIVFFGASDIGLQIGRDCVTQGKKPVLELAGNDGCVVWHDADLGEAAKAASECFYGSAQICMVPKYVLVHPAVAQEFTEHLLAIASTIRPGFPEQDDVLLSPVLKTDQFYDFLAEARNAGCDVLCGGRRVDAQGEVGDSALFFEPTIIQVQGLEAAGGLSCVVEETFFPMLPIVVLDDRPERELLDEVVAFVNANRYGLRNSLWTGSAELAREFASRTTNGGQLKINESHIAFHAYVASHGGTGRTGGVFGELNYVGLRTSHLQGICWGTGVADPLKRAQEALALI